MKLIDYRTIYVGGPISLGGTLSDEEIEANLRKFFEMEQVLQAIGHAVFNPAKLPKHNRLGEKASQADYLEQCFWMVMQSHGMVVLDDWETSHGTMREVMMMQAAGKPVFTEEFSPVAYEVVPQVVSLVGTA